MKCKRSKLAGCIDADYRKEKEWKERTKRLEKLRKNNILISVEHLREPLIIEKEDK